MTASLLEIIVIGAGASGLASAILLARDHGANVIVYERQLSVAQSDEESYPIGVNPRGMKTLRLVDPGIEVANGSITEKIHGWSIRDRAREIARLPSGTVIGTTRGKVVSELWRVAQQTRGVSFEMGMDLRSVDLASNTLTFARRRQEGRAGTEEEVVSLAGKRVLDTSGCFSKLRAAVEQADPSFEVKTWPWQIHFRNLFTAAEPPRVNLDAHLHYIFSSAGIYAAVLGDSRWVFSLSVNRALDPDCDWMLADAASPEGVARLKAHVAEHCPPAVGMLDEGEYDRFFTRRAFTGQVVQVNRLHLAERIAFLGDAAHAVIPATGEGINSALEDVRVLLDSGPGLPGWFEAFSAARIDDTRALSEYAAYLVESMRADAAERQRRSVGTVLMLIGQRVRLLAPTWNDKSFGRLAERAERYSEIQHRWRKQRAAVQPWANRLVGWFGKGHA